MTKQQILDFAAGTNYKTEITPGTATVWFHEGYGWNYRVEFQFKSERTIVTRYHTNGHTNADNGKTIMKKLADIRSYGAAEAAYHQPEYA
jgi:hypothetical protein